MRNEHERKPRICPECLSRYAAREKQLVSYTGCIHRAKAAYAIGRY